MSAVPNQLQRWTHRRAGEPVGRCGMPISAAGQKAQTDRARGAFRLQLNARKVPHSSVAQTGRCTTLFNLPGGELLACPALSHSNRVGALPPLYAVRRGVERSSHANGSALPVYSSQHVRRQTADAAKCRHVERRPRCPVAHVKQPIERLKAAYDAECGRQEARLRHELELVKALPRNEARQALIDETEAALGIAESKTGTEG